MSVPLSSAIPCILVLLLACSLCRVQCKPSDEVCQSLIQSAAQSHCQPWGNCTGLNCHNTLSAINVSFVFDKCTDPLSVHVSVTNSSLGTALNHFVYNSSDANTVWYDSGYNTTFGRNVSHAHIEVTGLSDDNILNVYIPKTFLPLNSSDCMCQSLTKIKEKVKNVDSPFDSDCNTDEECVGLECNLTIPGGQHFLIDTEIYPCASPPGLLFVLEDPQTHQVVFDEYFNSSRTTTLLGQPFNVTIVHLQYSMIIKGVLVYNHIPITIIPQSQIILDKEKCIKPTHSYTIAPSLIPTTTPTYTSKTCKSLKQLASQPPNTLGTCATNAACDTIMCTTFNGYRTLFTFLLCNNPPAIHTVVFDQSNAVIYEGNITNRTEIPLGLFETSLIVLVNTEPGTMDVEALIHVAPLGDVPFLPRTSIPIDKCQCIPKGSSYPSSCLANPTTAHTSTTNGVITSTVSIVPCSSNCWTHPSPSITATTKSNSSIFSRTPGIIIISVIILIVAVGLITITIITIVCVMKVIKKKSVDGYSFQRMANIQDNEDDVDFAT